MSPPRNPLLDVPVTRANRDWLTAHLTAAGFDPSQIEAALRQWRRVHAEDSGAPEQCLRLQEQRLNGRRGTEQLEVFFDTLRRDIAYRTAHDTRPVPINAKQSFSDTKHSDEIAALDLQVLIPTKTGVVVAVSDRAPGLTAKAATGDRGALAAIGAAAIELYSFPVAFVEPSISRDPASGLITRVEVPAISSAEDFDTFAFFDDLRLANELPLVSPDDVRRFEMAIASPLLRNVLPGMLGIYWVHGPPGSGKEAVAASVKAIWAAAGTGADASALELMDAGKGEDQKSFYTHRRAPYAHFREGVKQAALDIDGLIRLSGAETVHARGLYRDPLEIENSFTYLVDSAESVPDRREISRRTVVINTRTVSPEGFDGPTLRDHIAAHGVQIIASYKRRIEAAGRGAMRMKSAGGRPHALPFLAALFGATLDPVRGEGLDDIFRAMIHYTQGVGVERQTLKPSNAPSVCRGRPVYSCGHFVETMQGVVGYRALFQQLKHGRFLSERIKRELADRGLVGDGADYAVVTVDGEQYALRFVASRNSGFIFFSLAHAHATAPPGLPLPMRPLCN